MVGAEQLPNPEHDSEVLARHEALRGIVANYLDVDDAVFLDEMDDEDERIGYVYGRLLEQGEDPDEVLLENGVIEDEA